MKLLEKMFLFLYINIVAIISFVSIAHASASVWEVLRQQFSLDHATKQPEVQAQLHWLLKHPNYLQTLIQSEPYMYHIITRLQKQNLPGEIALIPMIESAYNPFAYSGVGAAGLWQIMPGTGNDLGLRQDWWCDGRRNILSSTDAALNYLNGLYHNFHNNWLLAFAAYDAGENTITRSIQAAHQASSHANFWSLSVPHETKIYVPRLLALAEIIQNSSLYHIKLPYIPYAPYFQEVNIGSQIDLNRAAKLAGISYRDLIKLNPGYNRWLTAPYYPFKLLIPANRVTRFNHNLSHTSEKQRTVPTFFPTKAKIPPYKRLRTPHIYKVIYIVDKNDSFQSISKKFNVSIREIKEWNALETKQVLNPGENLVIWRVRKDSNSVFHNNQI